MDLPKHIQDMADEAKRLQQEIASGNAEGNGNTEGRETDETKSPAPGTPESDAMKQDAAIAEDITPDLEADDAPGDLEDFGAEQKPEATQPDGADQRQEEPWKAKYKTLEGKYNAEVPRLSKEVRELKDALRQYQAEIDRLSRVEKEAHAAPPDIDGDIDIGAYEDYGDEMRDLATKLSWSIQAIKSLKGENDTLKQQLGGVFNYQHQQTYDQFIHAVRQAYPAFDHQDQDPEFLSWVDSMNIDLQAIGQSRDVKKAVDVYRTWNDLTGKYKQQKAVNAPTHQADKSRVEKQVAPPRSRPSSQQGGERKAWTRNEIAKVYEDIKRGVYSDSEALKMKQAIFSAQSKGLITE